MNGLQVLYHASKNTVINTIEKALDKMLKIP